MITLKVIGVLYVLSGLWCMFKSELAGEAVGYGMSSVLAQAEFITVYGGLQLGLGLAMILGAMSKATATGTLFVAVVFSVSLFAVRLISAAVHPEILQNMAVWMMTKLEFVIALALSWAYYRHVKSSDEMSFNAVSSN